MHLQRARNELRREFGDVHWIEGSGRTIDATTGEPRWRTAVFETPRGEICKVHDSASAIVAANEAATLAALDGGVAGIETPRLCGTGELPTGESWVLMSRVSGEKLRVALPAGDDETAERLAYSRAVGRFAGQLASGGQRTSGTTSNQALRARSEHALDAARALGPLAGEDAHLEELATIQARTLDQLQPVSPVLLHGDLGDGNVFGRMRDGRCEITGVIDWETAHDGMPDAAFAWAAFQGFASETVVAFAEGYRSANDYSPSPHAVLYFVIDRVYLVRSRPGRSPSLLRKTIDITRSILEGELPHV